MSNVTTEYCLDIIRKFEVSEENKSQNVLGIEGNIFLLSADINCRLYYCPVC